jgi:hypothetical protein
MPLTPSQRSMRARKAALTSWANTDDPSARARCGTEGLVRRFEREADPDNTLAPDERRRRAKLLFKAHMEGLRLKASKARNGSH